MSVRKQNLETIYIILGPWMWNMRKLMDLSFICKTCSYLLFWRKVSFI